jgi:beta-phosphoglucomutase-like phosphatase (HAD superfamily)
MSHWPAAVLFDFDGVIVNSEPLHFWAFHEVLRGDKIDLSEEEYYRELIGFDDRGAFKHIFEKRGKELDPRTFLRVMTQKSEKMMDLIQARRYHALPGVEEFIRALWWHYPLAICSGALREEIEAMLEGVALRDCFSVIVAAEDVPVGKPDPRGYLLTLRLLSEKIARSASNAPGAAAPLKPADALVVEDAPKVIQSVKAVGFPTLGVATSYPLMKLADATWQTKTLRPDEVLGQIPQLKAKFLA